MNDVATAQSFASLADYAEAIDTVIEQARQTLYVFDRDLRDGGWQAPQRYERLKRFVLGGARNRIRIVLHDADFVRRHGARLLNFQRQYGHAMAIHETLPEARSIADPLLIADGRHYVHRFHYDHPRGERVLHDRESAQRLLLRFDELWQASTEAVTATTLGL